MKILLIFPPEWTTGSPSLGVSIISSVLKNAGHEVILKDYNIEIASEFKDQHPKLWIPTYMSLWEKENYPTDVGPIINKRLKQKIIKDIITHDVDAVAFSVYVSSIEPFKILLNTVKTHFPNIITFAGGPSLDEYVAEELITKNKLDAVVMGEGEETVLELVEYFEAQKTDLPIKGCWLKNGDKIEKGVTRDLLNLDKVDIPDFEDLDMSKYTSKVLPFMISRGCVAKCNFCSETFFWKKYRTFRAERVFNWIKELHDKYGVRHFHSHDSLMNGSHIILGQIADLIIESGLKINWSGYARIDAKLTDELIEKIAKAGCNGINFGLESGSQRILDLMEKGTNIKDAYRIIPKCKKEGIRIAVGIIVGYPQEEEEDFQETVKVLGDLKDHIDEFCTGNTLSVPSNTPIFHDRDKYNVELAAVWNDWRTKDGRNTREVRERRLQDLRNYLDGLNATWF